MPAPQPEPVMPADGRLAKLTAARHEITFRGVSFLMSPLSLRDKAERKAFLRRFLIAEYRRCLAVMQKASATPEQIEELKREANESLLRPLASDAAFEPPGLADLYFRMLRHNHANLTRPAVEVMMADPAAAEDMAAAAAQLSVPEEAVRRAMQLLKKQSADDADDAEEPSENPNALEDEEEGWFSVFRVLAERNGWTPQQVAAMSDQQILYYVGKDDPALVEVDAGFDTDGLPDGPPAATE